MPFTGHATYDDTAAMFEDISDQVALLSLLKTPLLDRIGDPPYPAERETHQWREDSYLSAVDQLNEGAGLNNSDLTWTVDDGTKFYIGAYVVIDAEHMIVTGISVNDITVAARGHGDTAAATHLDNAPVYIVGSAALEGADPPAPKHSIMVAKTNYTQIFQGPEVNLSLTRQAIKRIGGDNGFDSELSKRLETELANLEWSVINGTWQTSTPAGSDTVPRTMQGIKYRLASNVTDLAGAKLTVETLEDLLRLAWDNGAENMNLVVCGSYNKGVISQMARPGRRLTNTDATLFEKITEIETDFFSGGLLLSRRIPASEILILTLPNISVMSLPGRFFQRIDLPQTGSAKRAYVEGEYTNEVRLEATHMWIKNTAITG